MRPTAWGAKDLVGRDDQGVRVEAELRGEGCQRPLVDLAFEQGLDLLDAQACRLCHLQQLFSSGSCPCLPWPTAFLVSANFLTMPA